ncbi:hypothetical protein CAC42_1771 [Sphaceloma murrayae]|uniref:Glycosyltransferase 2-like domain-containing protein n=1 Tax=Sphaceloma murrayae TaxID=2082308 RepID=A0A2K1QVF4_9PEZI|nr:hypothetical protein CAC42_1771 [Sphaceloma murrayae]
MLGRKRINSLARRLLSLTDLTGGLPTSYTQGEKVHRHEREPVALIRREKGDVYIVENRTTDWLTIGHFKSRYLCPILPVTALLAVSAAWNYGILILGTQYNLDRSRNTISLRLLFMLIEFIVVVPDLIKILIDNFVFITRKPRKRLVALGQQLPSVTVVICCCGEDIDVILDTVRAALDLDYPVDRFRVVVSDDGASHELEESVTALSQSSVGPALIYTARVKTPEARNKASNLNYAKGLEQGLPGGGFEYFAGLDADMIPERSWLRSSIAHFLLDKNVGLTQAAPSSYNQPVDDMLQQALNVFQYFPERCKDLANCAWCTGSGWMARTEALESVGGFSTKSIAEDVLTGSRMTEQGWRVVYLAEALQWGLVPDTFDGHVKQYTRWSVGTIEVGVQLGMWISHETRRNMTLLQRIFASYAPFADSRLVLYNLWTWGSVILLLRGLPFIPYVEPTHLPLLIRASALALFTNSLFTITTSAATTSWSLMRRPVNDAWMAPYRTAAHLRTFILPAWIGGKRMRFIPTGSLPNELNERDPQRRAPLHKRLAVILLRHGAWYHVLFIVLCWTGVGLTIRRAFVLHETGSEAFWMYLLLHLGWAPVSWLQHSVAFWVPVWYAVCPPNVEERERMLYRDERGVKRPKEEYMRMRWSGAWGSELLVIGGMVYGAVLLWMWW